MTSEIEREEQLRRLLSEAVEPVQPAPGAQTRLLARARAQAHHRKSRGTPALRWAVPLTLASLVVIAVVTVAFAVHGGNRSNSSASTVAGSATVKGPPETDTSSAAASQAQAGGGASLNPATPQPSSPPELSLGTRKTTGGTAYGPSAPVNAQAAAPEYVDSDGIFDTLSLQGGDLVATLSHDGVQVVSLPPPVGAGARVLGVTTLSSPDRAPVRVVFVRLTQAGTAATDTAVAVVGGRLTVLREGRDPVLLTIDPTHGYGCDQRSLVVAGNTTPLVVDGAQLVASPELRGVVTPAGRASGCGF
jgi:hypothetical protein